MARRRDQDPSERQIREDEFNRLAAMEAGIKTFKEMREGGPLRLVLLKARADAIAAVEDLVGCDPEDAKRIRDLQWAISRYDAFVSYAEEIIEAGRAASDDLPDDEVESLNSELSRLPDA